MDSRRKEHDKEQIRIHFKVKKCYDKPSTPVLRDMTENLEKHANMHQLNKKPRSWNGTITKPPEAVGAGVLWHLQKDDENEKSKVLKL